MSLDAELQPAFRAPGVFERLTNRTFGFLVGLGVGPQYIYLLQVRGRKTGRLYCSPVNLLEFEGKPYLVAPRRGRTQWVLNAEATGSITLKKGKSSWSFGVRPIPNNAKGEILKLYLERYASAVQRFFPIPDGSDLECFEELAYRYPVFELIPG
jgi:deazaflavin-dependent oxidoreductase (nitroreductase family)